MGSIGLILSGSDISASGNRLQRLDLGLLLMVDDRNFGSAFNTAMDDNRFENVALDLLTGAEPTAALKASSLQAEPIQPKFGPR